MEEISEVIQVTQEQLDLFTKDPDIIAVTAEEYQVPLIELFQELQLPRQLRTAVDIFSAAVIIYAVSQDPAEPLESQKLLLKAGKLCLSLFDQKIVVLPITFISAFTVLALKIAELKADVARPNIEVLLLNMQPNKDEEQNLIIINFLMSLINKYYPELSQNSLVFIIDYLAKYEEMFKLVEIICMSYSGNSLRQEEKDVVQYAYGKLVELVKEEDVLPVLHEFVLELEESALQDYVIECYFVKFMAQFASDEVENIVAGLLCSQFKIIGVKTAQCCLNEKVSQKTVLHIISHLFVHAKGSDDAYLIALCELLESAIKADCAVDIEQTKFSNENYIESILVITLLPVVLIHCSFRLATHLEQVSEVINTRKCVIEFFGFLLQRQAVLTQLSDIAGDQEQEKQFLKYIEQVNFGNQNINAIMLKQYEMLHQCIILPIEQFVLQEVRYRLEDESQNVKKCCLAELSDYITKYPSEIKILFEDMLLVQEEHEFTAQAFHKFVLCPIEESNNTFLAPLFEYIENCPIKLYESTFAIYLKEYEANLRDLLYLIESNTNGSFIILRMIILYSEKLSASSYRKLVDILHIKLIDNFESKQQQYLYILHCLNTPELKGLVEFDILSFVSENVMDEQFQLDSLVIEQQLLRETDEQQLVKKLNGELDKFLYVQEDAYSSDEELQSYLSCGRQIFLEIIIAIQNSISFKDNELLQFSSKIESSLFYHPLASVCYYYLMYATRDIEIRLQLFEKLINSIENIESMNQNLRISRTIANNLVIATLSIVYQYPDELGQFASLILEGKNIQKSYLIQRHVLYIVLDLYQLSLIKIDYDLFNLLFQFLNSENNDLRALSERLLLTQQYNSYFVKYIRPCVASLGVDRQKRQEIYLKVIERLDEVSKYELLNEFLQQLPTCTIDEQADLLKLIQTGVVNLTIAEEYERAASVLKRLNAQYTVQSVLPKLMERLCYFNAQKASEMQVLCIQAVQSVCQQMKVEYEELQAQFGSEYCLELMQIKW